MLAGKSKHVKFALDTCNTEVGKKKVPEVKLEQRPPMLPNNTTISGEREESKGGRFVSMEYCPTPSILKKEAKDFSEALMESSGNGGWIRQLSS